MSDKRQHLGFVGLLPTFVVFALWFGFATLISVWIMTRQDGAVGGGRGLAVAVRNGSFIIDEGIIGDNQNTLEHATVLRVLLFSATAVRTCHLLGSRC